MIIIMTRSILRQYHHQRGAPNDLCDVSVHIFCDIGRFSMYYIPLLVFFSYTMKNTINTQIKMFYSYFRLYPQESWGHFHWPLYSKKPLNPETQSNLRHLAKYKFSSVHTYHWLHIKLRARESFHVLNQGMYTTWRGGVCLEAMWKYTIVCLVVLFLCLKQQKMIPI